MHPVEDKMVRVSVKLLVNRIFSDVVANKNVNEKVKNIMSIKTTCFKKIEEKKIADFGLSKRKKKYKQC